MPHAKRSSTHFKNNRNCIPLSQSVSIVAFSVLKVISYNEYTGPYANTDFVTLTMKFWNQKNETCRFQYDGYGKLSGKNFQRNVLPY